MLEYIVLCRFSFKYQTRMYAEYRLGTIYTALPVEFIVRMIEGGSRNKKEPRSAVGTIHLNTIMKAITYRNIFAIAVGI